MPVGFFSIRNIEELDFEKLVRQLPRRGGWNPFSTRGAYIRAILESYPLFQEYEINTPMRLAHFLGQGLVETGGLEHRVENLNYSAARLRRIFPGYFRTDEIAREYERKPERIANRVYSSRLGNGPPDSGDGWRYRGRGFFQLTGRTNYRAYGEVAGFDLENDPELIERDLKKSVQVAAAYFKHLGLGAYADRDDSAAVSRGVNRGNPRETRPAHGEGDRILWTNKALDLVKDPQALLARAAGDGVLRTGASGEQVRGLQTALAELGYAVGAVDGVFGPATRRAVLAFQDEYGLPASGAVDEVTRVALDEALAGPIEVSAPPPLAPLEPAPSPSLDPAPTPGPPIAEPEPAPPPEPEILAEAPVAEPTPVTTEPAPSPAPEEVAEASPATPDTEPTPIVAEPAPELPAGLLPNGNPAASEEIAASAEQPPSASGEPNAPTPPPQA